MEVLVECRRSPFYALPNEALLEGGTHLILVEECLIDLVLRWLDAPSLLTAERVCRWWYVALTNSENPLWRSLCSQTGRITGPHTLRMLSQYSERHGWKRAYFWLCELIIYKSQGRVVTDP